jgi:hypothetical protein
MTRRVETMENWAVVRSFFFFSHECLCCVRFFYLYPSVKRARESFAYRLSSPDSFSLHPRDTLGPSTVSSTSKTKKKLEANEWAFRRVSWTTFCVTQSQVLRRSMLAKTKEIDWHYSKHKRVPPFIVNFLHQLGKKKENEANAISGWVDGLDDVLVLFFVLFCSGRSWKENSG